MKKRILGKYFQWFLLCLVVFLISLFLHECGHGIANALRGIECSSGFNRIGDIYKYPHDPDFRENYSLVPNSLLDFGVPVTLLLAIIGTILAYRSKNEKIRNVSLAVAITNSLIRLIPCLWIVLTPLLTGQIHIEDEYETGVVLANVTGISELTYIPAIFSILVSIACIVLIIRKRKPIRNLIAYGFVSLFCFGIAMILANYLDNILRINWPAM